MKKNLISGVIYSQFEEKMGPVAVSWYPEDLNLKLRALISLKTINIMIGEDKPGRSLAVLPFPSLDLKGLIKFLEIKDKAKRGGVVESTITILYDEADDSIFYKYLNNFELIFDKAIEKIVEIEENDKDRNKISNILRNFYSEIIETLEELKTEEISTEEELAFPQVTRDEESKRDLLRFKLIVCGDPMVGKTSVILRFTERAFKRTYISTIGVNITEKRVLHKKSNIELIMWDIAGQSKFQAMRKHFYKGADAAFLVFDLTNQKTFKNIIKWDKDINSFLNHRIPGFILGNKNDLGEYREVDRNDGVKLAKSLGYEYIETSALKGNNIDEAFQKISEILYNLENDKIEQYKLKKIR
ncbi:MAG: Rab family GTPase [Candidatus Helarchaeota archaeon]